jgi:hypothetical protein
MERAVEDEVRGGVRGGQSQQKPANDFEQRND